MRPIYVVLICGLLVWGLNSVARRTHSGVNDVVEAKSLAQTTKTPVIRVGIQAGHWQNDQIPAELAGLMYLSGAQVGDTTEWSVALDIAQRTAKLLQSKGVTVDVLPVTIPVSYQADSFVALHMDGNDDTTVSGYKATGSIWDTTGRSDKLAAALDTAYGAATKLAQADYISDQMQQYYAFNFNRFEHAINPATPGAILELGFLTNDSDRRFALNHPDTVAQGVYQGIMKFLADEGKVSFP